MDKVDVLDVRYLNLEVLKADTHLGVSRGSEWGANSSQSIQFKVQLQRFSSGLSSIHLSDGSSFSSQKETIEANLTIYGIFDDSEFENQDVASEWDDNQWMRYWKDEKEINITYILPRKQFDYLMSNISSNHLPKNIRLELNGNHFAKYEEHLKTVNWNIEESSKVSVLGISFHFENVTETINHTARTKGFIGNLYRKIAQGIRKANTNSLIVMGVLLILLAINELNK
jgi:hypothetical protein